MGNFIKTQSSFSDGAISPEFWLHDNLNGLSDLENMDVVSGGGLRRRSGLVHITNVPGDARLIPFVVNSTEVYMLVLTSGHLMMYRDGEFMQDILMPWTSSALKCLQYAQRFDTIIFTHPDFRPMVLRKSGNVFDLSEYGFSINSDMSVNMPFMRFEDSTDVNITVSSNSAGNNFATLTTNKSFWTSDNVGDRLLLIDKQWIVDQYISSTQVRAYTNGGYSVPSSAINDWYEGAFGNRRGWPCSITFHQDRLVFGGSRSYPAGVWMSQVGRHNNFNAGTGLDDEAIYITLLSQQRQQICTVVSSDNLQILTTVGEWAITSKPLTPSNVDIRQHTSVGSISDYYLPPQQVEGSTVFISATRSDIRELCLDTLSETYSATDLCKLASHLMTDPVSIAYNSDTRQLFVVMASGDMAVLHKNSATNICAWSRYKTQGDFKSVAVASGETYVCVLRKGVYSLEKFSKDVYDDVGQYGFAFRASGLPLRASGHNANIVRVRKISVRVLNSKSLFINGRRAVLPNQAYDASSVGFTGDVSINILGTVRNCMIAPWTISGHESLPTTIMSITLHGNYAVR